MKFRYLAATVSLLAFGCQSGESPTATDGGGSPPGATSSTVDPGQTGLTQVSFNVTGMK